MKIIDILIVNYNSTEYLLRCLNSIYEDRGNEDDLNIYIFDNASTDNLNNIINKFPKVILWKNSVNVGFAKAINYFITRTVSPFVLILNPDTYINKGFFKSALEFMLENPRVGIIGPMILEKNGKIQGSARTFPTPITALFGRSSLMTKIFPDNRLTSKNILTRNCDKKKIMDVDWVSGACMLVRRNAIEDVGMMDERFFLYWEDADWCKRMIEKGWRVVYYPMASIIHYTSISSKKREISSLLDFHISVYRFFCKHLVKGELTALKIFVFSILTVRFYLILFLNLIMSLYKIK